jgi:predicted amidohydrolase
MERRKFLKLSLYTSASILLSTPAFIQGAEPKEKVVGFNVVERSFSPATQEPRLTIGLANIHALVPNIEANKEKILRAVDIFKARGVNMAIFPEFCLAGYFWEDQSVCWPYMDKAVVEEHHDWIKGELEARLDDSLQFIIFNNIRKGPAGQRKYYNSTYLINKKLDYMNPEWIYDKTFLPGIENTYTISGKTDRLLIDTQWGRFGFSTCYDFCFSQLYQEMSQIDKVDAVIQMASWRGSSERDYPGMNVFTDNYYGELWDMLMPATAARNQIWVISANAVGLHGINNARFWGGSGLWAPSGMKMIQAGHTADELVIVHNVDIKGEKKFEKDDFDYSVDFKKIYDIINGKRTFTRL